MKKLFVICGILSFVSAFGQLPTRNLFETTPTEYPFVSRYDSLVDITDTSVWSDTSFKKFIGQEIIFLPSNEDSDTFSFGYTCFYSIKNTANPTQKQLKQKRRSQENNPGGTACYKAVMLPVDMELGAKAGDYVTPASAIEGKTFKILDILPQTDILKTDIVGTLKDYNIDEQSLYVKVNTPTLFRIILLRDEHGEGILWIAPEKLWYYPVTIKGYFDKLSSAYVGKTFYFDEFRYKPGAHFATLPMPLEYFEPLPESNNLSSTQIRPNLRFYQKRGNWLNLQTRQYEKVKPGIPLQCIEACFVGNKNEFMLPALILEDSTGQSYAVYMCLAQKPSFRKNFYTHVNIVNSYDQKDVSYTYPGLIPSDIFPKVRLTKSEILTCLRATSKKDKTIEAMLDNIEMRVNLFELEGKLRELERAIEAL